MGRVRPRRRIPTGVSAGAIGRAARFLAPPSAEGRPRQGAGSGIALIELMIGVVLALIILLGAGSLYLSTEKSFKNGTRKLRAQQEATLLTTVINRKVRVGSSFQIYQVPNRAVPADSGSGLALFDRDGAIMARLEWSPTLSTMVDSVGNRMTAAKLQGLKFLKDPNSARTVRYRFVADDERGNLVRIQSAASLRN